MEKNKTGKYFKYAIGEIVLVVIGILIALSINNWNETRKLRKVEHQYYIGILEDLKKNTNRLLLDIKTTEEHIKEIELAFQSLEQPNIDDNQIDSIISKTNYRVISFVPNTITIDDMVASGKTGVLKPEIKRKLFELSNFQQRIVNVEKVNNEDVIWHIKQYESSSDYSYPKLKKIRREKTAGFDPELLKKYTNVLAKKHEKSVDHKRHYELLLDRTLVLITILEKQISEDY